LSSLGHFDQDNVGMILDLLEDNLAAIGRNVEVADMKV
jgi:hypothetical protein